MSYDSWLEAPYDRHAEAEEAYDRYAGQILDRDMLARELTGILTEALGIQWGTGDTTPISRGIAGIVDNATDRWCLDAGASLDLWPPFEEWETRQREGAADREAELREDR